MTPTTLVELSDETLALATGGWNRPNQGTREQWEMWMEALDRYGDDAEAYADDYGH